MVLSGTHDLGWAAEDGVVEAVRLLEVMRRNKIPMNAGSHAAINSIRERLDSSGMIMNNFYARK